MRSIRFDTPSIEKMTLGASDDGMERGRKAGAGREASPSRTAPR